MTDFRFEIGNPWLLLTLIPALVLGIIPFFRLHKKRRRASKHIIPFIIHMVLIFLLATTLSGMRIVETTSAPVDSSVIFVVDVSESNQSMIDEMNEFIGQMVSESKNAEGAVSFGYVPFASEVMEDYVKKPGSFNTTPQNGKFIEFDENADLSDSNLADALEYAGTLFENVRQNKRVVLISDGRETITSAGNAYNSAQKLLKQNISVDASHFDLVKNGNSEVQLLDLTTNGKVELDKDVFVQGMIKSTINVTGTLKIYEKGEVVIQKTIPVRKGDNKFNYNYTPDGPGLHTITATFEVNGDTIEQNNMCCSWYTVEDIPRILIVYGKDQAKQIDSLVNRDLSDEKGGDYHITKLNVATDDLKTAFPQTMEALLEFDEVVLMNVDFADLPENADKNIKRYVEENGRGLVVTFGDTVYDESASEHYDSPIAEILPVELKVENEKESVAFIFIVDLSSSMREAMGTQTRYDVALKSIKHALDGLDVTKDYVSVIMFDETMQVAVEMQPLIDEINKQDIKDLIDYEFEHYYYEHYLDEYGNDTEVRVNTQHGQDAASNIYLKSVAEGGYGYKLRTGVRWGTYDYTSKDVIKAHGTKYHAPLTEADKMFANAYDENGYRLDVKQVVFISDGEPNDKSNDANVPSPYIGVVEAMTKAGIKTSAIGIGDSINAAAEKELRAIAEAGYSEPKFIKDADEVTGSLFDIIEQAQGEDKNSKDPLTNPEGYPMKEYDITAVLQGVSKYDKLWGYYGTTLKDGATMTLYADNHRPILAEWKCGLGKVTVFTSDFGQYWTQRMFDNSDGASNTRLVNNILVNSLNEKTDSTGIDVYENPNREWGQGTTLLKVEIPTTKLRDGETLKAVVTDAEGNVTEAKFKESSNKRYYTRIQTPDETENGTYIISIVIVDESGQEEILYDRVTTAIVGEYKEEYDIFGQDGEATINDIVKNQNKKPIEEGTIAGAFENTKKDEMVEYFYNLDDEFAIAALILFVVSILCRNFLFQKEKKRKVMTDEEQIDSMRNSGR